MTLLERVRSNTLVDEPRLQQIASFLSKTRYLPGDVAEVGVYKGGTALWIVSLTDKQIHLFDSFEGLPAPSEFDLHKKGEFASSLEHVTNLLDTTGKSNYRIHKGWFPIETGSEILDRKFSFVHIDTDMYHSVKDCLLFFYKRMVSGGIIALDDVLEPNCPGALKACAEFCSDHGIQYQPTVQSQVCIEIR